MTLQLVRLSVGASKQCNNSLMAPFLNYHTTTENYDVRPGEYVLKPHTVINCDSPSTSVTSMGPYISLLFMFPLLSIITNFGAPPNISLEYQVLLSVDTCDPPNSIRHLSEADSDSLGVWNGSRHKWHTCSCYQLICRLDKSIYDRLFQAVFLVLSW